MNLYEISAAFRTFAEAAEAGEIPEDAYADTLESIEGAFEVKAESIACIVKELRAEATAIKSERESLEQRQRVKENRADWLEQYLYQNMLTAGKRKFETPRAVIKITSGEKVMIGNEAVFAKWASENADDLLNYKEPTIDKTKVKAAIKAGRVNQADGAWIEKTEKAKVI